MEWLGASGSPQALSPTKRSPRGGAAVIPVEYGVENIKPIGTTRLKTAAAGRLGRRGYDARRPRNETLEVNVLDEQPSRASYHRTRLMSFPLILKESRMMRLLI